MIKSNFVLSAKKVVIGMVPLTVSMSFSATLLLQNLLPTTTDHCYQACSQKFAMGAVLGVSQPSEAGGLGALPPGLKSIVFF